jgi:hypothetical protein
MMSQLGPPEVEPEPLEIYPRIQVIYWGWNIHNFKKHIQRLRGSKINLIEIQPQNPRSSAWIFCRFGITDMANIGPSTPMGLEPICPPQPFPNASVLYKASRATCKLDVASEAGLGWLLVLT